MQSEPPKRPRRWFQFSLRSLMIAATLLAVPCAWLGRMIEQKRKERETVEALAKLGGDALYDFEIVNGLRVKAPKLRGPDWLRKLLGENFFNEVECVSFSWPDKITDAGLENLRGLTQLRRLHLTGTKVTDAGLEKLRGLSQLQELYLIKADNITDAGLENLRGLIQIRRLQLADTNVTDAGLESLNGLTQLEVLDLEGTKVTDAGLVNLEGLHQLQAVSLTDTIVTDAGLTNLKRLNHLKFLELAGTKITDAGLEIIKSLTELQSLNLDRSNVTYAGWKRLSKAFPSCQISSSVLVPDPRDD